jgi:hypothetical protein
MAYELEQILHLDFWKALKFVQKHPKLTKEQLIEAYYTSPKRRSFAWK